jgi:hypothetical protein
MTGRYTIAEASKIMADAARHMDEYPFGTKTVQVSVELSDEQWAAVMFGLRIAHAVNSTEGSQLVADSVDEAMCDSYNTIREQVMGHIGALIVEEELKGLL